MRTSRPSNHTRPRPSTRSASAGSTPDRRTSKATTRRQAPPGRSAAARRLPRRGKRYHRQPVAGAGTGRSASTGWPGTRRPGIDENGNHRECATGRRRARSARATRRLGARGPVRRGHRSQSRRFDSVNITALNKTRDLGTVQAYDGTHPGHSRSSFVMPPTIPAVPRGLPRRLEMPWNANGLSGWICMRIPDGMEPIRQDQLDARRPAPSRPNEIDQGPQRRRQVPPPRVVERTGQAAQHSPAAAPPAGPRPDPRGPWPHRRRPRLRRRTRPGSSARRRRTPKGR